jgi:hypothetical protein
MQAQQLETTDIFKSAVFLCNGGRLAGLRVTRRNQGMVSFLIEGEGILELDLDYRNGTVKVNAVKFRHTLNHLRDVLFRRLRETKGRARYGHRESPDRGHQNRR